MKKRILLTAAPEDTVSFRTQAALQELELLELPLEQYQPTEALEGLEAAVEAAENIVYGHHRNATFFIEQVEKINLLGRVKERVNLASDPLAASILEERGVPAVYPGTAEPIKLLEFMLRLRRMGPVLYPCGNHAREEIPGLLEELGMEVNELVLYRLEGVTGEDLDTYRATVKETSFDTVLVHSRRAATRLLAAFPELDLGEYQVVAGDRGVADKLQQSGIEADLVAAGSWESILDTLGSEI